MAVVVAAVAQAQKYPKPTSRDSAPTYAVPAYAAPAPYANEKTSYKAPDTYKAAGYPSGRVKIQVL